MVKKRFRCMGSRTLVASTVGAVLVGLGPFLMGYSAPRSCSVIEAPLERPPVEKGIALGLFSMDPDWDYKGLIQEVAAHGATHISLVWVWWQKELDSTKIAAKSGWTATESQLLKAIGYARALELHVTVFPIVRLISPKKGEWRGKIAPSNEAKWWKSYNAYIHKAAEIADQGQAQRLLVGSELLTREGMRGRWTTLITEIRTQHPSLELMYSANWDHFKPVTFWDLVDVIGMTAYWELGPEEHPKVEALVEAWKTPLSEVGVLAEEMGRPIVFSEIGYPSLTTGVRWPWDETRKAPISMDTQRIGYEAFVRAASEVSYLRGVYFWNWFGFGGPEDGNYTPRGKPAAQVIKCWFMGPSTAEVPAESQAAADR